MKKKNAIILSSTIFAIIAIVIIVFFALKKRKTNAVANSDVNANDANGGSVSGGSVVPQNDDFPLKVGSSGERVFLLQNALNTYSNVIPKISVDGYFGEKTKNALRQAVFLETIDNQTALNNVVNKKILNFQI